MNIESLFNSEIFQWIVLPLLIFLSRVLDVSLGTMRIVFVSRGLKYMAPLVGFFEVFIWLLAIGQIIFLAGYIRHGDPTRASFAENSKCSQLPVKSSRIVIKCLFQQSYRGRLVGQSSG